MLQETWARFENVTDYDAELFYGWWVAGDGEKLNKYFKVKLLSSNSAK